MTELDQDTHRLNQAFHFAHQWALSHFGGDVLTAQPVLDRLLELFEQAKVYQGDDRAGYFAETAAYHLAGTLPNSDLGFLRMWLTMEHSPVPPRSGLEQIRDRFTAYCDRTLSTRGQQLAFVLASGAGILGLLSLSA
mgnify:CR=1 FL=1